MSNHVAGVAPVAYLGPDPEQGKAQTSLHETVSPAPATDAGRYRLTIEKGSQGFVYKTLDRVTGEVIRQFPREEIIKLRQSVDYDPGDIIVTGA